MAQEIRKTQTRQTVTASWRRGCLVVEVTTSVTGARLTVTNTTTSYVRAPKRAIQQALRRADKS